MKSFVIKYTDEEGLTTYHMFDKGFSFCVEDSEQVFDIRFFDPALEDESVILAEVPVETANPFLHIALMQDIEGFMAETVESVQDMVIKAVDAHIKSGKAIFDLGEVCKDIYEEIDVFAESYAERNFKDMQNRSKTDDSAPEGKIRHID